MNYQENALSRAVDACGANRTEREDVYTLVLAGRFGPACQNDYAIAREAVALALAGIRANMTGRQRAEARILAAVHQADAEDAGLEARLEARCGHHDRAYQYARLAARHARAYVNLREALGV